MFTLCHNWYQVLIILATAQYSTTALVTDVSSPLLCQITARLRTAVQLAWLHPNKYLEEKHDSKVLNTEVCRNT